MTAEELWTKFVRENDVKDCEYESWAFGMEADMLANLVLIGEKTCTSSAYPLYAFAGEELPKAGEYSVILDSKDNAVCVIETTNVAIVPFSQATADYAYKEGEGDKTLEYWKEIHTKFFTNEMRSVGLEFDDDMKVVFEEFRVVGKP